MTTIHWPTITWPWTPPQARHITQHGDVEVATIPSKINGGFVAWAKAGKISGANPTDEPGNHILVGFGSTRDQARDSVLDLIGGKGFTR